MIQRRLGAGVTARGPDVFTGQAVVLVERQGRRAGDRGVGGDRITEPRRRGRQKQREAGIMV